MSVQHFHKWAPPCKQPLDKEAGYDSTDKPPSGHPVSLHPKNNHCPRFYQCPFLPLVLALPVKEWSRAACTAVRLASVTQPSAGEAAPCWPVLVGVLPCCVAGTFHPTKHTTPDYLVRDTDLFSLRLSNKKMTTANRTLAVRYEWIKIIPVFGQIGKKYNISFGGLQNFCDQLMCAARWKRLEVAAV